MDDSNKTEPLVQRVSALENWVNEHKRKSTKHDKILFCLSFGVFSALALLILHLLSL